MTSSIGSAKVEFWRALLEEHGQSGFSVKAFCSAKDVSVPSFYQWKRKLLPPPTAPVSESSDSRQAFVPIRLIPTRVASVPSSPVVQIFTPGGFTLRIDATTSHRDLSTLLRAIEDASVRGERC